MAMTQQSSAKRSSTKSSSKRGRLVRPAKLTKQADLALNEAYDHLNSCAAKNSNLGPELAEIFPEILEIGKRLYLNCFEFYQFGEFEKAKKLAGSISQLCSLLEGLSEQAMDNILELPSPPRLQAEKKKVLKSTPELHPALKIFESMIQSKLKTSSKTYGEHLIYYPKILSDVSKWLRRIEKLH